MTDTTLTGRHLLCKFCIIHKKTFFFFAGPRSDTRMGRDRYFSQWVNGWCWYSCRMG